MVFYFTATGNSLYVAKQLGDVCVSIPQAIHGGLHFSDESIGVVCPIYGHEMPEMVKQFLKEATFDTDYFYLILTYGRRHGGAAELAEQYLNDIGKEAAYINTIMMVDNYLPAFDMEEQIAIDPEKRVDEHIDGIRKDVERKLHYRQKATLGDRAAHQSFLAWHKGSNAFGPGMYRITDECIGCGICTRVCPAGCIHLEHQHAVNTGENCQFCMACIHSCPKTAIQLTMPEKNPKARYRNEHIRLTEIVDANHQASSGPSTAAYTERNQYA